MHHQIRVGLIGAGRIAQSYMQAFQGVTDARLVAIADVRGEVAETVAESSGCRAFDSHERLAAAMDLDAVIICTPPVTHAGIAQFFLERKIHVLCEKPLSTDVTSAKLMCATAQANGVKLTMASKFRYAEDVVRARQMVVSGMLGDIVHFENVFSAYVDMRNRWNSVPTISGGGVLIDNGTHSVDLMRYFLGPLAEVYVVEGVRVQNLPVEETVHMVVRTETGVTGSIDLSWTINKDTATYLSIYGSRGTVCVGWKESRYRENGTTDWAVIGNGYDKVQAFRSQIENFAHAVKGEEPLVITPEDAIASVAVIERAYRSLRRNRLPVPAPESFVEIPAGGSSVA